MQFVRLEMLSKNAVAYALDSLEKWNEMVKDLINEFKQVTNISSRLMKRTIELAFYIVLIMAQKSDRCRDVENFVFKILDNKALLKGRIDIREADVKLKNALFFFFHYLDLWICSNTPDCERLFTKLKEAQKKQPRRVVDLCQSVAVSSYYIYLELTGVALPRKDFVPDGDELSEDTKTTKKCVTFKQVIAEYRTISRASGRQQKGHNRKKTTKGQLFKTKSDVDTDCMTTSADETESKPSILKKKTTKQRKTFGSQTSLASYDDIVSQPMSNVTPRRQKKVEMQLRQPCFELGDEELTLFASEPIQVVIPNSNTQCEGACGRTGTKKSGEKQTESVATKRIRPRKHHRSQSHLPQVALSDETVTFLEKVAGIDLRLGVKAFDELESKARSVREGHLLLIQIYLSLAYLTVSRAKNESLRDLFSNLGFYISCAKSKLTMDETRNKCAKESAADQWLHGIFRVAYDESSNEQVLLKRLRSSYVYFCLKEEEKGGCSEPGQFDLIESSMCVFFRQFIDPCNDLKYGRHPQMPIRVETNLEYMEDTVEPADPGLHPKGGLTRYYLQNVEPKHIFFVLRKRFTQDLNSENAEQDWVSILEKAHVNLHLLMEENEYEEPKTCERRLAILLNELCPLAFAILFANSSSVVKKAFRFFLVSIHNAMLKEEQLQCMNMNILFRKYLRKMEKIAEKGNKPLVISDVVDWCSRKLSEDGHFKSFEGTLVCQMIIVQALCFKTFGRVVDAHFLKEYSQILKDITWKEWC